MVPASAARWALVLLEHKSERTYLLVMLLNAGYVVVSACNSQAMCLHEVQVDRFMSVSRVADAVTYLLATDIRRTQQLQSNFHLCRLLNCLLLNLSGSSASFGVKLLCRRCLFIVVKESKVEANRQVMAKKRTHCSL